MNACRICGRNLPLEAKFCAACGNVTARSQSSATYNATLETSCEECGGPLMPDSQFCPTCGKSVDEAGLVSVSKIIDELKQIATPFGATVLSSKPERWKTQRVEVQADEDGLLAPSERERLHALLSKLLFQDSYLCSEVTVEDKSVLCVWHVIGGGAFPLKADHAESVLLLYESLLPKDSTVEESDEIVDAPSLTNED